VYIAFAPLANVFANIEGSGLQESAT